MGPRKSGDELSPQAKEDGAKVKPLPKHASPKKSDKENWGPDYSGVRQVEDPKRGGKGFVPPNYVE